MVSSTLVHAQRELDALGTPADDSGRLAVEKLLGVLVELRDVDSETAREWVVGIFSRLASHEVLTPVTGRSHEWRKIPKNQQAGGLNYQNVRESSVLAQADWVSIDVGEVFKIERAVDVAALYVQRGTDESTGYRTWMPVTFPYMPQRFQVEIREDDARSDAEVEEEARAHFSTEQVTFTKGGRTS